MSIHWRYPDQARLIPVDIDAEETTAGIAVVSAVEAQRIYNATSADYFHDPVLSQIIGAAAVLPVEIRDGRDEWTMAAAIGDHSLVVHGAEARALAIAAHTGIEVARLKQLVAVRTRALFDGELRGRLVAAADARAERRDTIDRLHCLGVDVAGLTEADARLTELRDALLHAATSLGGVLADTTPEADAIDALTSVGALVGLHRDDIDAAVLAALTGETPP